MPLDPQLLTGIGSALSIFLASAGSAIASSHSGIYAVRKNDMKSFVPIIISGVLAIYGIIVSVLLIGKFKDDISQVDGYRNLSAGLAVGLACCASGLGIANFIKQINEREGAHTYYPGQRTEITTPLISADASPNTQGPRPAPPASFLHLTLSLFFLEAIGLYGLIVALFLIGN